jgi:hypothetical protein
MFYQSFTELANQKNVYVRVVFSEKSSKKYILPFTTFFLLFGRLACFVAFWRDSRL